MIFCSPITADAIASHLKPGSYQVLSSEDAGLALGVRALVMKKSGLPKGVPVFTGGGTTRLISRNWVVWSGSPARFEPGTPAVINVIAFARALELIKRHGTDIFNSGRATESFPAISIIQDEFAGLKGHEMLSRLRRTVIGKDISVSSDHGNVKYVNLDNAASTRTFEPVYEVYRRCLITSPDSHREIVANSRNVVAEFFDAPPTAYDIVFTSNTTEALNLTRIRRIYADSLDFLNFICSSLKPFSKSFHF